MKKTNLIEVDPKNPDIRKIRIAAKIIKAGGLVAFPTETVYGLGANALNSKAIKSLYEAKNRPIDNPPIIHIENSSQLKLLCKKIPNEAWLLIGKFWPGPLTLIFHRSAYVPRASTSGLETIAVRMPKHNVALALIKSSKTPIAAPSANLSGKPSPTSAKHVLDDLDGKIDAILDGGSTCIGLESTVINFTSYPPEVLRPGGVPVEELRNVIQDIKIHPYVLADREIQFKKPLSPGMKHKHYAPKAKVILVEGSVSSVIKKIKDLTDHYRSKCLKVGILGTQETINYYDADVLETLGSRFNLGVIAKNLFRLLREFDNKNVDIIIAEGIPDEGLGLAVMNRLRKAAGYNIVKT